MPQSHYRWYIHPLVRSFKKQWNRLPGHPIFPMVSCPMVILLWCHDGFHSCLTVYGDFTQGLLLSLMVCGGRKLWCYTRSWSQYVFVSDKVLLQQLYIMSLKETGGSLLMVYVCSTVILLLLTVMFQLHYPSRHATLKSS